ncbi:MAG: hypothetical protein JWL77_6487 [Chthonomonadaceae bacterium]|nr:hypothetical protein [Chthonomonadaceae bacterium]
MKRTAAWILGAVALGVALNLPAAHADTPPLLESTFEKDAGDWEVFSPTGTVTGKISITHEAAHVKEGKGALQLDYAIKKGDLSALALRVPLDAITKMKSLHFWVQADHATSLLLVFSERGGGRYQAPIAVTPNIWQEVAIAPSDLILSDDAGSPPDPDAKLDLDQIESIGLADIDSFLAQGAGDLNPYDIATGQHTLYLSHFVVSDAPLPAIPGTAGEVLLTPFIRPQIDWLTIGDMSVQKVTEKPLSGPSMKVAYTQKKMKVFGMVKAIPTGAFANAKQIGFAIASQRPVTLVVQVETKNGLKYKNQIQVPEGSLLKEFALPFADFTAADDSSDVNAPLDLKQISKILFLDITGFIIGGDQDNTLWINKLHTSK